MRRRTSCSRGLSAGRPGSRAQADLGGQAGLHLGGEDDLAAGDGGDRVADALAGRRLGEVGADPAGDRLVDRVAVEVRAEQHDARGQAVAAQRLDDVDPAQRGHLDVEDGDVGMVGADRLERLAPVAGLPHELELGARAHRADDRLAIEGMIVGHEDRRALGAAAWPRTTAAQPYCRATRRAAAQMSARARSLLTQPAAPAARAALLDVLVERGADDQHLALRRRIEVAQAVEHLEAVEVGHPQVEQHHVGPQPLDRVERRLAAVGLAEELEAAVDADRAAHAAPEHGTVIDDQDADGAGAAGLFRS